MPLVRSVVLPIALAAFTTNAGAHHDRIAELTTEPSNDVAVKDRASDSATVGDSAFALFESEMLLHLAFHAPAPSQVDAIDLAFANHQFNAKTPGRPDLDALREKRQGVYKKLRDDYVICEVSWPNTSPVEISNRRVAIAQGLPRHVLLNITNSTDQAVDLMAQQQGDHDALRTAYTILPRRTGLIPVALTSNSLDDRELTLELGPKDNAQLRRRITIPVRVQKPALLQGRIVDADRNQSWPGRVYVLGSDRMYRRGEAHEDNETLSTKQLLQFWDLGKYYQLPFFYSDGSFEVRVPPGITEITLERGFEHEIVSATVDLAPGEVRDVQLASGRMIDMRAAGWISGDTHVHWVTNAWNVDMPLELLSMVQRAEDLSVANNLTLLQRGPSRAFINPSQAPMGTVQQFSDRHFHVEMGEEYRNEDLYGHLCFLNIDWLVQPIGTGSIIAGPDALDYPINKTAILACREQGGISCEAHGLGGVKDVPVNVVHKLTDSLDQIEPENYYDFLDCGFRLPLTNGSDHPARVVGQARAYVKVDGDFSYDKWIDGIRQCRTFTTSGPLLFLSVNGADIGDELRVDAEETLTIRTRALSRRPLGTVQIISNGEVLKEVKTDEREATLELKMPAGESRWIVARCSPTGQYNAIKSRDVAHTSAIYVDVDGRPRFVKRKAERWIRESRQHIRDIRAKGRFANDEQRNEAIRYVEAGISLFEELIATRQTAADEAAAASMRVQLVSDETEPTKIVLNPPQLDHKWATHMYARGCQLIAECLTKMPGAKSFAAADLEGPKDPPNDAPFEPAPPQVALPPAPPAEASQARPWPHVDQVEPQPLLLQVDRLMEALDYIGNPLPNDVKRALNRLQNEPDAERVAKKVQSLLDPLCLAAVAIEDGKLNAFVRPDRRELVERGWRSYLVKVDNAAGLTSRLRVESPHARSLPHAKQEDVESRWLGLSTFDGRPLQPNLSGLELEYRIVQLYSRDAGEHTAVLEFSIDPKPGVRGRQIREWRFDEGTDGWQAANQVELEARDGALHATGIGGDPFITAEVGGAEGELILRFSAETDDDGILEVFWWTEERPAPDGDRTVKLPLIPGGSQIYEAVLPLEGVLAGVRIDPNVKPCKMRFDWIDLSFARRRGETWDGAKVEFDAKSAQPITLQIRDKQGEPAAASLQIRDSLGRIYPEQTKRLAPDFFFHPQIYRLDGEVLMLPPGEYQIRCQRGPHTIPETKTLVVGDEPDEFVYDVNRWIDPTVHGWWSGDHHIHSAGCLHYVNPTEGVLPRDMLRQTMGEDLNVGCCLTWGPCFDYQKQFFTGAVDKVSRYPYLLRYDVEVSGFGSHASGHLNLLRLKQQIYPGGDSKHHWPTLGLNTLRWAKKQGAICGPAHSANGLTNYVGKLEEYEEGPHGLPHYNIPAFDGIGACEYVVDVTHQVPGPDGRLVPAIDFISAMDTPRRDEWNMWYHTLNCGYRTRVSGETDFPCMSGERVGIGRVYVKVEGDLNFDDWIQGIQDGRSYVSDGRGHLIDFEARVAGDDNYLGVGDAGSEIELAGPRRIVCRAKCAVRVGDGTGDPVEVELVAAGKPVATAEIPSDGSLHDIELSANVERSTWLALRVFPHVHTNPFFVVVDDQPIRASRASAEWCLRCVEQCWREKEKTYDLEEHEDAREAYDHAREAYLRILKESLQ